MLDPLLSGSNTCRYIPFQNRIYGVSVWLLDQLHALLRWYWQYHLTVHTAAPAG